MDTTKHDYSLLIVDDDRAFRELIRYELERNGYKNLLEAEDGEEALDLVAQRHVDLILLDLRMPKLEGEEVLRIVKGDYPKVRVIVLTGQAEEAIRKNVLALGADAFVVKPYDSSELLFTIRKTLGAR